MSDKNIVFKSFFEWLNKSKEKEDKQLKDLINSIKTDEDKEKYFQQLINTDIIVRNKFSEHINNLIIKNSTLTKNIEYIQQYSAEFGTKKLVKRRVGNIFGDINKDIKNFKKNISSYIKKKDKFNKKISKLNDEIREIEQVFYKIDIINKKIEKLSTNDPNITNEESDQQKLTIEEQKKGLKLAKEEIVKNAEHLRLIDRPISFTRDIERELKSTLSTKKRIYNTLTGRDIEINNEGKFETKNIITKLDNIIQQIEFIDKILKNKYFNEDNYENLSENERKIFDNSLKNNIFQDNILKNNWQKLLIEQKSALIQSAKHMRSFDHRGFLHEEGILQELKWTNNKNKKALSINSKEVNYITKKINFYNGIMEKASNILKQKKVGKEREITFLKGIFKKMDMLKIDNNQIQGNQEIIIINNKNTSIKKSDNSFNLTTTVKKDKKKLQNALEAYESKRSKLYCKSEKLASEILNIEKALYKIDEIQKEINNNKKTNSVIEQEVLKTYKNEVIKNAENLRLIDRPISFTRDIERELRMALSCKRRIFNTLTGQDIEIKKINNTLEVVYEDVKEKLGNTIEQVEFIDKILKNKHLFKNNLISIDENEKKIFNENLKDNIMESNNLKDNWQQLLIEQKSALIQSAKHMRSFDHRGFLHEEGILQELKWTNNKNKNNLNSMKKEEEKIRKKLNSFQKKFPKNQEKIASKERIKNFSDKTLKELELKNSLKNSGGNDL